MRKSTMWFLKGLTQTKLYKQMARGWKFWIKKVEELYYPCSESKGADRLRSNAKLICTFVFAYATMREK